MRRAFVDRLVVGVNPLDRRQSHHVREVLRLGVGGRVELFDRFGVVATGVIVAVEPDLLVEVAELREASPVWQVTIASGVPKGERADWLVEKLSELGTTRWIPMQSERSVVVPRGTAKADRWRRLATEAAKQSRRAGVMEIDPLRTFDECLLLTADHRWIADVSGDPSAVPARGDAVSSVVCLVGPEGGFSPSEIGRASAAGFTVVRLAATVLRVETAAIVAAARLLGPGNGDD